MYEQPTPPTPPKLRKAKAAAVTAAAMATTAALTFGVTSPTIHARPDQEIAAAQVVNADVDLTAVAGFYGVGPIFWVANALGLTPEKAVLALAGVLGEEAQQAVQGVFDLLGLAVETGAPGPLPGDVYDSVNGLEYSGDLILGIAREVIEAVDFLNLGVLDRPLGLTPLSLLPGLINGIFPGADVEWNTTVDETLQAIVGVTPLLNQRRAIILSEGFGGITTSLAYRDMIKAVTENNPDWGEGVTGQWLIFVNNPSRPGGGLAALFTPFTNLFGLNLSTPAGGSYTNEDSNGQITKILNTSVLDITAAYNIWSDAPTTLNPLAWANAAAGGFLITYLIPDGLNLANTNIDPLGVLKPGNQIPILLAAVTNGGIVMLDPTGGQGLDAVPQWAQLVNVIDDVPIVGDLLAGALNLISDELRLPEGQSYFVTYDSGNLPILQPLDLLPRLLGLAGVNVPQPFHNSIEDALRMAINAGYQDVDPVTLERGFDMAGDQALIWRSALTPSQQFDAGWTISNTLLDGIQENLLNPVAWTPSIVGQAGFNDAAKAIIQNAVFMAVSQFINEALDAGQDLANEGFTALRDALKPMLDIADQLNAQAEGAIDDAMQVDKLDPAPNPAPVTTSGTQARLMSTTEAPVVEKQVTEKQAEQLDAADDVTEQEPPAAPSLSDLAPDVDLLKDEGIAKDAKSVATSLKKQREALRDAADERVAKTQRSLDKRAAETKAVTDKLSKGDIGGAAQEAGKNVQKRVDRLGKDIRNGVDKVTGKKDRGQTSTSSTSGGNEGGGKNKSTGAAA